MTPGVVEREYKRFYYHEENGEDFCILQHSNEICILTLSSLHPLVGKEISKINFLGDDPEHKYTGKKKKGAQIVHPNTEICRVECTDGSDYKIIACIQGKLVEINQRLVDTPNLMRLKPESKGFIALILPRKIDVEKNQLNLLDPEQYKIMCEQKQRPPQIVGDVNRCQLPDVIA